MAVGVQYEREFAERATLRRIAYGLLIAISVAGMVGHILAVKSKSGRTPMLSANDRSRWANIRSLVDHGTYAIDDVVFSASGQRDPEWYSIDMVKHRGRDGHEHYYSSKPTLFTTLMAGPYWIVKQVTRTTLASHPFHVIRILLILFNVLPMLLYFFVLAWAVDRLGTTDYGRLLTMAAATFGTYLTTFSATLNNHLPAAVCVIATVGIVLQVRRRGKHDTIWFVLAGLLAASAVANELPALSFFCLVAALLFWISPRQTLQAFVPAALLVTVAAIGTNYWAHGTWSTPYAHRKDGLLVATVQLQDAAELRAGKLNKPMLSLLWAAGLPVSPDTSLSERAAGGTLSERPGGQSAEQGWVLWDPNDEKRWSVRAENNLLRIRAWDNWYEYDGSYWSSGKKQGVDRGERSKLAYAFHALAGHHGIFSLTPLWLASMVGAFLWLQHGSLSQRTIAWATLLLTAVCLAFYILFRGLDDRNYGGVSCCFRWTIWLIPLWLLCLIPAADAMARSRWLRRLGGLLLGISVLSATYNSLSPWSHPWLFDYWTHIGWIHYP